MPFGTITSDAKNYEPRVPGIYELSTVTFGQPRDYFEIRGGTRSKDGTIRGSIARIFQKDIDINGTVMRKNLALVLSLSSYEAGFTAAEIDARIADISNFATTTTLTRLLQGEN